MNMKIFLDMDGVIANFFGGLEKKYGVAHWKELDDIEKRLDLLINTDFFYTLEKFETTDPLVDFVCYMTKGDWGICSSPLRGDYNNSSYWKRRWLEDNGIMPRIENLILTTDKKRYAINRIDGEPNMLIDDKPSNITEWEKAGGVGILWQANQDSYDELIYQIKERFCK